MKSFALTPKNSDAIKPSRDERTDQTNDQTDPDNDETLPKNQTQPSIFCAPSAMRMPISFVRCATL